MACNMRETRSDGTHVTAQLCSGALNRRKCVKLVNVAIETISCFASLFRKLPFFGFKHATR
jgi:hypothetical protein